MSAKTKLTVRPLADRVAIVPVKDEGSTMRNGLYIPDAAQEKPVQGRILAVGPGARDEHGNLIPIPLKVGDRVIFSKYAGAQVEVDGEEYLLIKEADVIAKLDEED